MRMCPKEIKHNIELSWDTIDEKYSAMREKVIMWAGDGWQQAPDGRKDHDPQWWVPLEWDGNGRLLNMTRRMSWRI